MKCIDLIKQLDNKSNEERRQIIVDCLNKYRVEYRTLKYATGTNLVVDLGCGEKRIGVSSHFDRVPDAPGANDNGSAIAVCVDIIKMFQQEKHKGIALRVFFFDEEETGLKGSAAYTQQFGVKDLFGLINLELVGIGDKFAIWPVDHGAFASLLETFEHCSNVRKIETRRFDKIITNAADHLSFRKAGLKDAFTITCISDKDIEVANRYYTAMHQGANPEILSKILGQAPIFKNYHQPGDNYHTINEQSVLMTSAVIWDTILAKTLVPDHQ